MKQVIVVGGGISGLATARALRELGRALPGGFAVTVLEAAAEPGGKIRTQAQDGWRVERGPNGFLDSVPRTLELARSVGLADRVRPASDAAADRYLWLREALRPLPHSPASFLGSSLLSLSGRLRVLLEPVARKRREDDETVAAFARRRIGKEAARSLVSAMVLGVFGGDYERLSLQSTFPAMRAMENEHGSLFRAMLAKARARRRARRAGAGEETLRGGPAGPAGVLTSFEEGMAELPMAVARDLESAVVCSASVEGLQRQQGHWRVAVAGEGQAREAEAVVLACEAFAAARLVAPLDDRLASELAAIRYAAIDVVALGYPQSAVPRSVEGFGFLAPRGEGVRILGCLWDASIFPDRAPAGHVLLRCMIGGDTDPAVADMDEESVVALVRQDLRTTLGIETAPAFTSVTRWPRAIPQYEVGHRARLDALGQGLEALPGLHLAGNAYRGVAMNACIADADRVAVEVLADLQRASAGAT